MSRVNVVRAVTLHHYKQTRGRKLGFMLVFFLVCVYVRFTICDGVSDASILYPALLGSPIGSPVSSPRDSLEFLQTLSERPHRRLQARSIGSVDTFHKEDIRRRPSSDECLSHSAADPSPAPAGAVARGARWLTLPFNSATT